MSFQDRSSAARKLLEILGVAIAVTLLLNNTNSIYGLLSTTSTIGTTGVVSSASLGIYSNSQCTTALSSIDWGSLSPGGNKNVTIYVKNTGSVALTLTLSTSNWTPTNAPTYLTLTWNYAGATINSNAVATIILTLRASSGISGISSYQFQVTITGTQA
jgi:hypothetical protein